jgi:2-dehydropantoate 2-reductase
MLHVLGAGAIGLLHAHHFAKRFPNQVVLLKKKCELQSVRIKVTTPNQQQEYSDCLVESTQNSEGSIENLLIATRAYDVLPALESIQHRLGPTNILLLTNGVLQVEKDLERYSKHCFLGLTTHGVIRNGDFEVTHTGRGETWMCPPSELSAVLQQAWGSIAYHSTSPVDIRARALEKVAINACINPLTALWNCRNGHLLTPEAQKAVGALVDEICDVVDLQPIPLLKTINQVVKNTSKNMNSMLVDVRNGRRTEIDYINGYFCCLAQEKGVSLPSHTFVANLVNAKYVAEENRIR